MGKQKNPAEELERFLNYIDACRQEYKYAYDMVGEEDKRLQDPLHEMEFAKDKAERNRVATKLQRSRNRRENKDIVLMNEKVVEFFNEPKNRDTLNRMRQLLGQQRKEEEYLMGERAYIPRVGR